MNRYVHDKRFLSRILRKTIYRFKRFMIHSNVNEFIRIELLDFFAKYSEF